MSLHIGSGSIYNNDHEAIWKWWGTFLIKHWTQLHLLKVPFLEELTLDFTPWLLSEDEGELVGVSSYPSRADCVHWVELTQR